MYYFLAHKLLALGGGKDKIKTIADNTFLLALDGDVDFQPSALRLLVDRMKRNPQVGAACGRIHPIGSGKCILIVLRNIMLTVINGNFNNTQEFISLCNINNMHSNGRLL